MFEFLKKAQKEAKDAEALARVVNMRAKNMSKMGVPEFLYFARPHNINPLLLHAFFISESSGHGFLPDGRLLICPEPHVAYRNLINKKLGHSLHPDLFYPGWKGMKSPVYDLDDLMRWDHVIRAADHDFNAGLCGASYGAGQQLGEDWKLLGFDSVEEFLEVLYQGQFAHLEIMIRKLRAGDQMENLRKGNLKPVISYYNGEGNVDGYLRKFTANMELKRALYV